MISLEEGTILVRLARESIESYFSKKLVSVPESQKFKDKSGVFVTLNKYEKLRGCIGFPEAVYELDRAIIDAARSAAFRDPRFSPVKKEEMEDITVEITVLTPPELIEVDDPIEYLDKIEIGKHGLIIRKGFYSGLLLPQVFTDYESTPKEALEMTCEKAGLARNAWKEEDAKIYRFSGQIFEEEEPNGKVKERK